MEEQPDSDRNGDEDKLAAEREQAAQEGRLRQTEEEESEDG